MDYAQAKACFYEILKAGEPLSNGQDYLKVSDDEKFSDYLDSLDFVVMDLELLNRFPQYRFCEPFTKKNTMRDVCNFIVDCNVKKPLE